MVCPGSSVDSLSHGWDDVHLRTEQLCVLRVLIFSWPCVLVDSESHNCNSLTRCLLTFCLEIIVFILLQVS